MTKKIIFSAVYIAAFSCFFSCKSTPVNEPTLQELIQEGRVDEAKSRFMSKYDINEIDKDGNTAMHLAAKINDSDLVTFLIIKGADSELKNYSSQTPLHVAIENDSRSSAQILAAIGGNLFARNGDGITALDMGLSKDPAYYDLFITTKAGEIRDSNGETIVHYFVKTKDEKAILCCAKKDIPISVPDNNGKTPLDTAFDSLSDAESVEIAAALIMNGAEHVKTDFGYFQDAVTNRNLNYRFEDGQTPLHISSIMGHSGIVKYLLENNAATNVQDSSGATPLHEAVRYGHIDIAKMLLDSGADINAKDNLGKTPVLLVIPEEQRTELYKLLLSYRADVSRKDMYGDTVLHTATLTGVPVDILQNLVTGGADVNGRNKDGITPLALSIENNIPDHIKFYADNGADINSMDTKGNTPLILALKSTNIPIETIINKKNIDSHDSAGNTPLHVAIINNASLQKIQYILSLTEDVNARNADGNSALYLSILKNRQRLGELLLAKNADIFSANNQNYSPLRLALKAGGSVMDWLITSQTIKASDGSGNTALHYAAEWELKDAIAALIQKGADQSARNANGETPVFNAVKTDNPGIIDQLVSGGSSINVRDNLGSTPLHVAVRWDAVNSAKRLLALGIDVNAQNSSGKSALAESVVGGKYETARLLLNAGADPNTSDVSGRTILMDAIRGENPEVVKLLLANNANPQIQEINGRNAYHEAAASGNIEIIEILRDAGGNPLARDKNGSTPFSISINKDENVLRTVLGNDTMIADSDGNTPVHIIVKMNGSAKLLSALINAGYPADTRNSSGYTPLGIAVENNYAGLTLALLEKGANPFISIDKKGTNAATIALTNNNNEILANIIKYAGTLSDIQGNTILHYAAKMSDAATIKKLLSYGLDTNVKNISGETPYMTAIRWRRTESAALLLPNSRDVK